MNPDASTIAAGAPIEVDLAPIAEGQDIKVSGGASDLHQPPHQEQIDEARAVPVASLPDPQGRPGPGQGGPDQWLVVIGICTHLRLQPIAHEGNYDGFFCPCTACNTTPRSVRRGPRRPICRCRPINSFPIAKIQIG